MFDRNAVRTMRTAGKSWRAIATQLGVGVGTVRRAFERKPNARELAGAVKDMPGMARSKKGPHGGDWSILARG